MYIGFYKAIYFLKFGYHDITKILYDIYPGPLKAKSNVFWKRMVKYLSITVIANGDSPLSPLQVISKLYLDEENSD